MAEVKENSQQTQEEAQKRAEEKRQEEAARIEALKKRAIIFRMGEETGIVIEKTKDQFEHSLFREQYKQALKLVNDIIRVPADYDTNAPISNIIAFCGERGEGKTSALMTVRNILADTELYKQLKDTELFPDKNEIKENTFKVLNLVDPAFFDGHHNILELLLGQMYAEVLLDTEKDKNSNNPLDCEFRFTDRISERNRLMQLFQAVRSSLGIISRPSNKSAYDNLEEIDELAAGILLKEKFNKLLKAYAEYFGKTRVLICIDDLDLNVSEGYKMAEEIRKYLCSPAECVVLMAIKVEQMIDVVKSYLRAKIDDIVSDEEINDMAIRYVLKLIPENHRVKMPSISLLADRNLMIYEGDELKEEYESIKEAVVRLIYQKTRYIFVNGRNISPIVPDNLRELRLLWATLWPLNDGEKNDENHKKNKTIFKRYFYENWVKNLEENDAKFISSLVYTQDLITINKSVVKYLAEKYSSIFNNASNKNATDKKEESLLEVIIDMKNTMQNVSVGDVMYVLNAVENLTSDTETRKLLFFIKSFYSITLYESYDDMTIDNDHIFAANNDVKVSIYKYDRLYRKLNPLQRVLNGSYFTYDKEDVFPREELSQQARDIRNINPKKLKEIYEELVKNTPDTLPDYEIKLNTLEFFALTTTYDELANEKVKGNKKRTLSIPSRIAKIRPRATLVNFDVLSIFYNIVNIKYTYERWNDFYHINEELDPANISTEKSEEEQLLEEKRNQEKPSLFDIANGTDCSLYKKMLNACFDEEEQTYTKEHYLVSDATIRFIDVQLAIMDLALNNKSVHKVSSNKLNIRLLYNDIQDLKISLYPTKKGANRYPLSFNFLTPVIKYLNDVEVKDFDEIFNSSVSYLNYSGELRIILSLLTMLFSRVSFPMQGSELQKYIRRTNPEVYTACGNSKYWNKIIVKAKTYDSIMDMMPPLARNEELRGVLINNAKLIDILGILDIEN